MHDFSLPAADRCDADGTLAPPAKPGHPDERPALVVALPDGYFRAWRYRGGPIPTNSLARARLFFSRDGIEETLRKLKRLGIAAEPVQVNIVIGKREA